MRMHGGFYKDSVHMLQILNQLVVNLEWTRLNTIDILNFTFLLYVIPNSMQSLCDLSHLVIISLWVTQPIINLK